ncbi:MAG: flagellar hook-associated protein FlgK [Betaproteobacteria bacterium]|nr:flagellar hook-associated protein FlgK [Betaproteobacteria bacterium]
MGNGIFGIGISGLNAAQAGLLTTGHNISNAATPGYNRQQTVQSSNSPQLTGSGYLGQGVQVSTVRRVYSQFLAGQVSQAQTQSSQLESYYSQIRLLNNMLGDPSAGLSPTLQSFFNGLQDVAANPASVPSRQALLGSAQSLATRFQELNQRFTEFRDGVNSQIAGSVTEINSLAQQIANLNQSIALTGDANSRQPANDLLDQRDALVAELGRVINIAVVRQSDGTFNVFIGNGQALVLGALTLTLKTMASSADPAKTVVGFVAAGNTIPIPESTLQGGSLGGALAFRSGTLDSAQNALGRVAIGLAQTFNDQHRLGQDLSGAIGGNFFSTAVPGVISVAGNNPASSIAASISDSGALTTSDYQFGFDGTNYTLTRLSDNTSVSSAVLPSGAAPLSLDGISITAATINAGESFVIQPTRNGARDITVTINDTGKIAAAAPIRTAAALTNSGSATISAGTVNSPPPVDIDLQQPVTIAFHVPYDGQFDVTGAGAGLPANNQAYTAGADISFHGWTVQISGSPAAGDTFTIGPNSNGASDNRNALLLGSLQIQNTLADGTATYQSAYGQLVSQVGNKTRELEVTSKAQANLVAQTEQAQQSLSGVNLDEEAANLLRYQQAYQAAGKVIQIANMLFDTLLDLDR